MKTFELGKSGVTASSVVLGLMRIGGLEDDPVRALDEAQIAGQQAAERLLRHARLEDRKTHKFCRLVLDVSGLPRLSPWWSRGRANDADAR